MHGTLPSHTQNKHIFNKYIHGLHEPELLRKCAEQQGSFDNLHDVAKLQSQKLRMQDMTVSRAPMQDSIMPLQETPRQNPPNQNRNANNQNSSGGFATAPVPRVTPFTLYQMAPKDWTEDMIRSAAARWIDWKCHACKEFGHAKYVCDTPAVRQWLDAIQLEMRPSLAHDRSKSKALQGAFHASHTHITQVNPSLVSPECFNQQMNQVAKAMNPKPKTPSKSPLRTTQPPTNTPRQFPTKTGTPKVKGPKMVTIKDKPTVIPSSGPTTWSHAQRDLSAQFNAFLHALELEEESPEEKKEPVEGQVAVLSEAEETEDEVQYDSEPAEDDASESVPEETGEVTVLSPAHVTTDTDLEAINHCLFPIRIHGHASRALYWLRPQPTFNP